ncbi:S8 family serine peptidase [Solimonas marina]|uniref:S8 family serine peptidase n=1 Tax=Solimonas marina TaxID=2714601 RepID=A0A969W831_9GAMM|nr:S8 family serine peptidase [Solimonas marina]NKF21213.1 S8 family serine peptidase [Solimonas marina]
MCLPAWATGSPYVDAAWVAKVDTELLSKAQADGVAEFAIRLSDRADLSAARAARTKAEKGRLTVAALQAAANRSQAPVVALLKARGLSYQAFWAANVITARGSSADIQALAALSAVDAVDYITAEPVVPAGRHLETPAPAAKNASAKLAAKAAGIEPSIALVHAPEVWALGYKGQGVVVGDHDIGVQWDHPALQAQYRGWDATTQTADHDYNWHNAFSLIDPFCPDTSVPCDSNGHGTHTTGTMVGDDGAGMQIGMAPSAQWIACRSLLDPVVGVGTVPTYLDCMQWMLAPYPTGDSAAADAAMAPDVVNNSWGCAEGCAPPILQDVNEATEAAGIVQVVSAGNDGDLCNTILYPLAVYDSSFTVGATDNSDAMASFSSRGAVLSDLSLRIKPNVVAPGVDTLSSWNDGDYNTISGTSMAGPHVAGLVALILSAEPKLIGRVRDVRSLIENTAVPIVSGETCSGTTDADIPNNTWGYGRIDALAAIQGLPKLSLSSTVATSAEPGVEYAYALTASLPTSAKIDATGVAIAVTLPAGTTLVSSSETAAADAIEGAALVFAHDALAPGESWTVSLTLRSDNAGTQMLAAKAVSDQQTEMPATSDSVAVGDAGSGGSSGGGGGALDGWVLGVLLAAWASRRGLRRRRA